METPSAIERPLPLNAVFKATVYVLLLINLGFYVRDDWQLALDTLAPGASIGQWAAMFATNFDDFAWIVLIFVYELEAA